MVRQGLRAVLDAYPDVELIGEAGNGREGGDSGEVAASRRGRDGHQYAGDERHRATTTIKMDHPEIV